MSPRSTGSAILLALMILPGAAWAESASPTLAELEARALERYPEIEAADAEVAALEAQLSEVTWRPFSGVRVQGTLSPTPERRGDAAHSAQSDIYFSDTWGVLFRLQLRLSLPVVTFGRLWAEREAARHELEAGAARAAEVRRRTRERVQRAWSSLQLARQSLSLLQEGASYLDRASRYVDSALEGNDGDITESDRLQLQVVAAELDARISDARRAVRLSTAALRLLADLEPDAEVETPPLVRQDAAVEPLERLIERALSQRPDVVAARSLADAAEARRRAARAGFLPELRLTAFLDYAYSDVVDDQTSPFAVDQFNYLRYGVGLELSWSLDVMTDRARLHQAEARLRRAQADASVAVTRASLEVEEARISVEECLEVADARERGRRASRGWLVSVMQGIEVGVLDPPELVDALRAYFEQSFLYLEALSQLDAAVRRLRLVTGDRSPGPDGEVEDE